MEDKRERERASQITDQIKMHKKLLKKFMASYRIILSRTVDLNEHTVLIY